MNVSLTKSLEEFVSRKVKSGRYTSASEVVREALRLLEERDQLREMQLGELRRDVLRGIEELDSGEGQPLDVSTIKSRARKELKVRRKR